MVYLDRFSLLQRLRLFFTIGLVVSWATACAKGENANPNRGYSSNTLDSAIRDNNTPKYTGSGGSVASGTGGRKATPNQTCDAGHNDSGQCICLRIAMIGRLPTYGAVPGSDTTAALQEWLNVKSTATADMYTKKPEFTSAFLGKYDLLIFQALDDSEGGPFWQFSESEITSLQTWVKNGGGILTLTGYGNQAGEVDPTNKLLSFTGLSYNKDDIVTSCPNDCCYCVGNSVPITGWNRQHPISENITAVGAFVGRSINVSKNAETVVSEGSTVLGATVQVDKGRVFMFADEWVTYTSQWTGQGVVNNCSNDKYNPCYGTTTATLYQVPQFWYNAILWVSGDRDCFRIDEPTIIY